MTQQNKVRCSLIGGAIGDIFRLFVSLTLMFVFTQVAWCQGNKTVEEVKGDDLKVFNEKVVPAVPIDSTRVFDVVEQMPSFKGGKIKREVFNPETGTTTTVEEVIPAGNEGLVMYLSKTIKYPVVAEENGIQGRVVCTFVVNTDGSISDVKVIKSVDPSLDKEAVRVIKSMPNWNSGRQDGKPIRVRYTLPVTFRL